MKEKGSLEQIAMHCIFMGLPQSGKTSLLRRLVNKRLSSHASTGVAERAVHVELRKSTVHVSGLFWCELDDLGDEAMSLMHDVPRLHLTMQLSCLLMLQLIHNHLVKIPS